MELKTLPDVAEEKLSLTKVQHTGLSWVGMNHIALPVQIESKAWPAQISAFVNLKPNTSRGIHMSRLYNLLVAKLPSQDLSWKGLENLLEEFISSQNGLADQARLVVQADWPLMRASLKSDLQGWRLYPVTLEVLKTPSGFERKLKVEILYSSTCPASTALSRDVWKEHFDQAFPKKSLNRGEFHAWIDGYSGMPATPHAQRSKSIVEVKWASQDNLWPAKLIMDLESVLSTPVQTVVKRVDEQEFARLNGQNPMFCEDAARRVQDYLNSLSFLTFYRGVFEHQESLHAHNAVAEIVKSGEV